MIKDNIITVHENIEKSCLKAGRDPKEVTLISVTKTKPLPDLRAAYEAGERNFGENKVQELVSKIDELPSDIKWHMIGHLQRNKVKQIVGRVELIHSVDSYRLAEEINIQSIKKNVITPILIEINIGDEISKFGIRPDETEELIREISELKNIKVKGLMTVAPNFEDPEDTRPLFRSMHNLFIDIKNKNIDNVDMCILSMGMTNDYKIAVEEGATMVRVGTAIFGPRNYNK
jgi:hypothetical protein